MRLLWVSLITGSLSVALAAPASTSEAGRALQAVAGLQADFVQRFTPHGFKVAQVEKGSVTFGSAPRMRWHYQTPEQKTFVFNGETSWLYIPAERQVTVAKLGDKEKQEIPFLLISDPSQLNRYFTMKERQTRGAVTIEIKPRNGASMIREVILTTDRSTHRIRSLTYTDRQGNRTVFEFAGYRKAPAADLAFQFTPPPGVDVVESQ
jgi:chaperone LolA